MNALVSSLLCAALFGGAPTLVAKPALVPIGTASTFTYGGTPGALWVLYGSFTPVQIPLAGLGTVVLDLAHLVPLGAGSVLPSGVAELALAIPPTPSLAGAILYTQAGELAGGALALSGGAAIRAEAGPLSGSRAPVSLVASLDGAKLYVAFEEEGALAVVASASGALLREIPLGPRSADVPFGALELVLAPEGDRLFAINPADGIVTVIDVATDAVVGRLFAAPSARGAALTGSAGARRLWVVQDRDDALVEFAETPFGWSFAAVHALAGRGASAIEALADGRLLVAHRVSRSLELLDQGGATLATLPLPGVPNALAVDAGRAFVASFAPLGPGPGPRRNAVFEVDLGAFTLGPAHFADVGTDYADVGVAGPWLLVAAYGSGTLVVADRSTLSLAGVIDLNPAGIGFAPSANPAELAATGSGASLRVWTADFFRDALRPVLLGGAPPFLLESEVAVSHTGQPLAPLTDLSQEKDGAWWFESVQFFNGAPLVPNPVTCATCHPGGAADGLEPANQRQPLFGAGASGPWGSKGTSPSLLAVIQAAFSAHSVFGGTPPPGSDLDVLAYLSSGVPYPPSPFLAAGGSLTGAQAAGRALFEGKAGCSACHAAPAFLPPAGAAATIAAGVGTGLVPANVPSLRGIFYTPPYFKNGAAATLADVAGFPSGDLHGTTSTLSAAERADLVEYLKTL